MRDDLKSELDILLDSYDENDKKQRQQRKLSKSEYADFVENFYKVREETIWPAMKEIAQVLKSKAHDSHIELQDDEFQPVGGKEAKICMYIYPNGEGMDSARAKDYPYLSFTAGWYEQAIQIYSNTRVPVRDVSSIMTLQGSSGLRGSFQVEDITKEFVQEEIAKIMKEVFLG